MIKQGSYFYTFKIFSLYPSLTSFISTKKAGNFLPLKNNDLRPLNVFEKLGIDHSRIVLAQQLHSANIAWVHDSHAGQIIKGVDALITDNKNLFLLIIVADCIPLLFYDPVRNLVAASHSGWQGSLQKIGLKVAEEFVKTGSSKENLLIAFGPAIGSCHYDIPASRAKLFDLDFGKNIVTMARGGKIYLNLLEATKKPLLDFGVPEKNIEIANVCTAENTDQFYSLRGEEGLRGEFAAIIGLRS